MAKDAVGELSRGRDLTTVNDRDDAAIARIAARTTRGGSQPTGAAACAATATYTARPNTVRFVAQRRDRHVAVDLDIARMATTTTITTTHRAGSFAAIATNTAFARDENADGLIAIRRYAAIARDKRIAAVATGTTRSAVVPGSPVATFTTRAAATRSHDAGSVVTIRDNRTVVFDVDRAAVGTRPAG